MRKGEMDGDSARSKEVRSRLGVKVVLGVLLVIAVALFVLVWATQSPRAPSGGPDEAAQANVSNALTVARSSVAPDAESFAEFRPSELESRLSVRIIPASGSGSPRVKPGKAISVEVCADGSACRELVVAASGAKGKCWFGRYVLGSTNDGAAGPGEAMAHDASNRKGACWAGDAPDHGWTYVK